MTTKSAAAHKISFVSSNGKHGDEEAVREKFRRSEWFTRGLVIVAALIHEEFLILPPGGSPDDLVSAAEIVASHLMYFDHSTRQDGNDSGDHVFSPLYSYWKPE